MILVSDNNLVPEQPRGPSSSAHHGGLYAEDDASRVSSWVPTWVGRLKGSNWRWSPTATAAAAAAVVVSKVAAAFSRRLEEKRVEEEQR